VGKGTTVERLKIIKRSVFFKARNLLSGPEIPPLGPEFPPLDKISWGPEIPEFLTLRNSAKSFTKCYGATFCKGAGNFINFRTSKIWLSPLQQAVVHLAGRGWKF
jgi:hypothetical protein